MVWHFATRRFGVYSFYVEFDRYTTEIRKQNSLMCPSHAADRHPEGRNLEHEGFTETLSLAKTVSLDRNFT